MAALAGADWLIYVLLGNTRFSWSEAKLHAVRQRTERAPSDDVLKQVDNMPVITNTIKRTRSSSPCRRLWKPFFAGLTKAPGGLKRSLEPRRLLRTVENRRKAVVKDMLSSPSLRRGRLRSGTMPSFTNHIESRLIPPGATDANGTPLSLWITAGRPYSRNAAGTTP